MSLTPKGPSSVDILGCEKSAFSQGRSYSLSQGTFHPLWIPETQMLLPDHLWEVERNEGWLLPLDIPIPTPFLFPLTQDHSTFSLKRLRETNPFHFLPHWHHQR